MTKKSTRFRDARQAIRINLSIKLLVAFGLVVLVAVSLVAVLAGQSAEREVSRFVRENQIEPPEALISQLGALYAQQGGWTGAEAVLSQFNVATSERPWTPPLILVDVQGQYIASNWMQRLGEQWLESELVSGWPVEIDGETVGTLIVPGSKRPPTDVLQERFSPEGVAAVERVRNAILIAGLIAGGMALAIAGVLAWRLVRPLRRLTAAAEGIAQGDLSQRVPVSSHDEVGELAATFNHMAAELERAERVRRNMTADVAHELRTPLSVVRGKLEGILDGVYPATPEHLEPVLEATEVLTYLVEDLRLLAQAEAGQLILEKRETDLRDLLRDAQVNFDPQATDQSVTLELDLPPDLPKVMADWHRVVQVLSNLLTNALRHTPEGGRVILSATPTLRDHLHRAVDAVQVASQSSAGGSEKTVKVTVADTGPGIPPEDLPHVFDRFWRGEKSRSRAGGGSGLGLAIARQLVELHGGTIGAESTPGQGSQFWFTLPAV